MASVFGWSGEKDSMKDGDGGERMCRECKKGLGMNMEARWEAESERRRTAPSSLQVVVFIASSEILLRGKAVGGAGVEVRSKLKVRSRDVGEFGARQPAFGVVSKTRIVNRKLGLAYREHYTNLFCRQWTRSELTRFRSNRVAAG